MRRNFEPIKSTRINFRPTTKARWHSEKRSTRPMMTWDSRDLAHSLRSSPPELFCKEGVLESFAKLFFNKVASLKPVSLFKKRLRPTLAPLHLFAIWGKRKIALGTRLDRWFPLSIAKFLRVPFLKHFSGCCVCHLLAIQN